MKTNIRLILLCIVIILGVTMMVAQTVYKDVIYLKNGSIIKGTIVETVPEKSIKIETADGNFFVYLMSDIEKITKEKDTSAPMKESKPTIERLGDENQPAKENPRSYDTPRSYEGQSSNEGSGSKFSIFGGLALPLGNFAKKEGIYGTKDSANSGYAKTGWTAGAQFVTGGPIGFLIEGSYTLNKIEFPTTGIPAGKLTTTGWTSILALVGIKIGTDNSSGTNFFIAPFAGALFEKTPEITFTPAGSTTTQTSAAHSATGFAYGANVEAMFGGHVTISGKFIASKPKFKWSESAYTGGPSVDTEFDQSVSLLLVTLGFAF